MSTMLPSIEFLVPDVHPDSLYAQKVRSLTAAALSGMSLTKSEVQRIVIAGDDSYLGAILELSGKTGYTNTTNYRGLAKAIPLFRGSEFVGSNLLFHHAVIDAYFREPGASVSQAYLEQLQYGFFHEFGHCIDFSRRRSQHGWVAPALGSSHFLYYAACNGPTFFGEFAACYFSARFISKDGFRSLVDSTISALASQMKTLQEARIRADHEIRDEAIGVFWRGLIEFGKIQALRMGAPSLKEACPSSEWPGRNPEAMRVFAQLGQSLESAWASYPNCGPDFDRHVRDAWFALTAAEGFCFEVRPDGDCFYFR